MASFSGDSHRATLAVVGHSFVRRLGEFVDGRHLPEPRRPSHASRFSDLRLEGERVAFFGQGGAKLTGKKTIFGNLQAWLGTSRLKVVYFEMGSNNLCDPNVSAEEVARHLLSAANFLHAGYDVGTVVVGQVTIRKKEPYCGYNAKVRATNVCLRQLIEGQGDASIQFARLRGLIEPASPMFHRDGIHLSPSGNARYAQGVRGAFIRALTSLT